MEENQPKTGSYSWKFGALAGGATLVFSLMLYSMDLIYEQNVLTGIIPFILTAVAIILGIIQFKIANQGFLTLSEALKLGTGIGVIAGIIGVLYLLIFSNIIEPDYLDKLSAAQSEMILESNPKMTPAQVDQAIEMQKKMAWIGYPVALILYALFGLVIGLVTGLIVKKEKPAY